MSFRKSWKTKMFTIPGCWLVPYQDMTSSIFLLRKPRDQDQSIYFPLLLGFHIPMLYLNGTQKIPLPQSMKNRLRRHLWGFDRGPQAMKLGFRFSFQRRNGFFFIFFMHRLNGIWSNLIKTPSFANFSSIFLGTGLKIQDPQIFVIWKKSTHKALRRRWSPDSECYQWSSRKLPVGEHAYRENLISKGSFGKRFSFPPFNPKIPRTPKPFRERERVQGSTLWRSASRSVLQVQAVALLIHRTDEAPEASFGVKKCRSFEGSEHQKLRTLEFAWRKTRQFSTRKMTQQISGGSLRKWQKSNMIRSKCWYFTNMEECGTKINPLWWWRILLPRLNQTIVIS